MIVPALVAGGLWGGWLLTLTLGRFPMDLFGLAMGHDFLGFYSGARILRAGKGQGLYDFARQQRVQNETAGTEVPFVSPYINPPLFAVFLAPLTPLPYPAAFAVWSLLGAGSLFVSLMLAGVEHPGQLLIYLAGYYPVFATVRQGQNSLISLLILSTAYALASAGHPVLAGVAAGALVYKPQLLLGPGLSLLLSPITHWPTILSTAGSGVTLVAVSWSMTPDAWRDYLVVMRDVLPGWSQGAGGVKNWMLTTWPWMFWKILIPSAGRLVRGLGWLCWILGAAFLGHFAHQYGNDPAIVWSTGILLSLWLAPHANDYEWTLLILPAVLMWQHAPELHGLLGQVYSLVWGVMLVAGSVTRLQLAYFRRAANPAMPCLAAALWLVFSRLP